jgi:probable rRNA maturation factor
MAIAIQNRQRTVTIHTAAIKRAVQRAMLYLGCADRELSIVFANDQLIRMLNRDYRHQDRPTNVLAFPQSATSTNDPAQTLLGDVIVSLPTAAHEAHDQQQSLEEWVIFLIVHGLLHLLGYDHERSASERRRMEALEAEVRRHLQR